MNKRGVELRGYISEQYLKLYMCYRSKFIPCQNLTVLQVKQNTLYFLVQGIASLWRRISSYFFSLVMILDGKMRPEPVFVNV